MSENHSTPPAARSKPAKPYPGFPLTAHPAGYWCKQIRGKLYYFGRWEDPDGALQKYQEQKDALHAGRKPRTDPEAVTVKDVANAFLNHKQALLDAGELSPRTWQEYKETTDLLVAEFGKHRLTADLGADDFAGLRKKMAKQWGPVRLGNTIQRVRSVFKYALSAGMIDKPVCFGPGFVRPSKKVIRLERARRGPKLFTADEIRRLLDAAGVPLRAMILLGINCGFGNNDCGILPLRAVDLEAGMINFPRPKTGIPRRCALWPETVRALNEALARRPNPKRPEHQGLVFITQRGLSWAKDIPDSPVGKETSKLLKALGINGRQGLGFYTLRHTFRTVADESQDQPAVDFCMGHEVPHMSSVYRETISDTRLRAVAEYVHAWLFPPTTPSGAAKSDEAE
jgi:integrase